MRRSGFNSSSATKLTISHPFYPSHVTSKSCHLSISLGYTVGTILGGRRYASCTVLRLRSGLCQKLMPRVTCKCHVVSSTSFIYLFSYSTSVLTKLKSSYSFIGLQVHLCLENQENFCCKTHVSMICTHSRRVCCTVTSMKFLVEKAGPWISCWILASFLPSCTKSEHRGSWQHTKHHNQDIMIRRPIPM